MIKLRSHQSAGPQFSSLATSATGGVTRSAKRPGIALLSGALVLGISASASAQTVYQMDDGFVSIEAESTSAVTGWVEHAPDNGISGASDQAMRYMDGPGTICSTNAGAAEDFVALEYHFRVEAAGTYRVKMNIHKQVHCVSMGSDGDSCHSGAGCSSFGVQSMGDSCDEADRCWRGDISNDAYVRMRKADGTLVSWIGGNTSITKLFGGNGGQYSWSGNNSLDASGSKHAPDWDLSPGDYVFEVRGRSEGFSFDRVIIFDTDTANEGDAKAASQSSPVEPTQGGTGGDTGTGTGTGTGSATGGDTGAGGDAGTGTGPSSGTDAGGGTATGSVEDDDSKEGTGSGDDSPATMGEGDVPPNTDASCSVGRTGGGSKAPLWLLGLGALGLGVASRSRRRAR